ncbi:MAG: hypothetical protein WD069_21070 [Planctomycetales bacterium]
MRATAALCRIDGSNTPVSKGNLMSRASLSLPRAALLSSFLLASVATFACFDAPAAAAGEPVAVKKDRSPDESPSEVRIRQALRETTEIAFADTPLEVAMQVMADLHDIPVIIDGRALEEAGIQPDVPVNLVLGGVKLESALEIILRPLNLDWVVRDEVLQITSAKVGAATLVSQPYSIAGLTKLGVAPDAVVRLLKVELGLPGAEPSGLIDSYPRAVAESVAVTVSGPAVVPVREDLVVVRHNRRAHARVARLLAELETAAANKPE